MAARVTRCNTVWAVSGARWISGFQSSPNYRKISGSSPPCRIKNNARTDGMVTIPADMLEKLMNIAAQQKGVNDAPTLMLFAEVRRLIEEARRSPA